MQHVSVVTVCTCVYVVYTYVIMSVSHLKTLLPPHMTNSQTHGYLTKNKM